MLAIWIKRHFRKYFKNYNINSIFKSKYSALKTENLRHSFILNYFSFFPYTSRSTQPRISKPSKKHSRGSTEFPNQKFRQIG